ncbi:hypothetical protein OIO90_005144 [Microbotryomycetes sp. JL221]|nr:hypothetical protein OIO90_005144 [Microbotryomycetes sp. JL221]
MAPLRPTDEDASRALQSLLAAAGATFPSPATTPNASTGLTPSSQQPVTAASTSRSIDETRQARSTRRAASTNKRHQHNKGSSSAIEVQDGGRPQQQRQDQHTEDHDSLLYALNSMSTTALVNSHSHTMALLANQPSLFPGLTFAPPSPAARTRHHDDHDEHHHHQSTHANTYKPQPTRSGRLPRKGDGSTGTTGQDQSRETMLFNDYFDWPSDDDQDDDPDFQPQAVLPGGSVDATGSNTPWSDLMFDPGTGGNMSEEEDEDEAEDDDEEEDLFGIESDVSDSFTPQLPQPQDEFNNRFTYDNVAQTTGYPFAGATNIDTSGSNGFPAGARSQAAFSNSRLRSGHQTSSPGRFDPAITPTETTNVTSVVSPRRQAVALSNQAGLMQPPMTRNGVNTNTKRGRATTTSETSKRARSSLSTTAEPSNTLSGVSHSMSQGSIPASVGVTTSTWPLNDLSVLDNFLAQQQQPSGRSMASRPSAVANDQAADDTTTARGTKRKARSRANDTQSNETFARHDDTRHAQSTRGRSTTNVALGQHSEGSQEDDNDVQEEHDDKDNSNKRFRGRCKKYSNLTPQDYVELRKEKNRLHAKNARFRKKQIVQNQEKFFDQLKNEVEWLRNRVWELEERMGEPHVKFDDGSTDGNDETRATTTSAARSLTKDKPNVNDDRARRTSWSAASVADSVADSLEDDEEDQPTGSRSRTTAQTLNLDTRKTRATPTHLRTTAHDNDPLAVLAESATVASTAGADGLGTRRDDNLDSLLDLSSVSPNVLGGLRKLLLTMADRAQTMMVTNDGSASN